MPQFLARNIFRVADTRPVGITLHSPSCLRKAWGRNVVNDDSCDKRNAIARERPQCKFIDTIDTCNTQMVAQLDARRNEARARSLDKLRGRPFEMTPLPKMNPLEYLARPGKYGVLQEKRLENVEKRFHKQHEASKYLRNAGREIYNAFVELHQVYRGSGTIIPEVIGSDCLALLLKYLDDRIWPSLLRFNFLQTNGRRLAPEADVFLREVGWDPQILLALSKDLVELQEKDDFLNGDKISIVHDHLVDIAEAVDFDIYDEEMHGVECAVKSAVAPSPSPALQLPSMQEQINASIGSFPGMNSNISQATAPLPTAPFPSAALAFTVTPAAATLSTAVPAATAMSASQATASPPPAAQPNLSPASATSGPSQPPQHSASPTQALARVTHGGVSIVAADAIGSWSDFVTALTDYYLQTGSEAEWQRLKAYLDNAGPVDVQMQGHMELQLYVAIYVTKHSNQPWVNGKSVENDPVLQKW